MAKFEFWALFLVVLLASTGSEARRTGRKEEERGSFRDLKPRKPREIFSSEGGRIEKYDPEDYHALCEAEIGAMRVTLEADGLALPLFKDSNSLLVVTKGKVRAGIVSPFTDRVTEKSVFELRKGDVVAIPRGFAVWAYNDGRERAQFLGVSDTTHSAFCGSARAFHLAGAQTEGELGGGVLQGFAKDIIAHAWDVDEATVQRVMEGQRGRLIIKVGDRQRRELPSVTNTGLYMDFVYRLGDSHPDVRVRNGGELRQLNSLKLPVLKKLGLSTTCVRLEGGALKAPSWIHNGNKVIYGVEGRGRVQVVRENGESAADAEMEEGSLLVVPANYPTAKVASEDGFSYGEIYKTDMPIESFLAGRNSVYKGIPPSIVSSSFQIDDKLLQKLEERRTEEAYIFPPRRSQPRSHHKDAFYYLEDLVVRNFV